MYTHTHKDEVHKKCHITCDKTNDCHHSKNPYFTAFLPCMHIVLVQTGFPTCTAADLENDPVLRQLLLNDTELLA